MVDLEWLPGIDYWGARNIDRQLSGAAAAGALFGIVATTALGVPVQTAARVASHTFGWRWGVVVNVAGWLVAAYLALLAIAHWQSIDEES